MTRRVLLDTHVLLWWLGGDKRLSERAHLLLRDPTVTVHLSAVSVMEMAIKARTGKLVLPLPAGALAADAIAEDGFVGLPVTLAHAAELEELPLHHRDPFDRLLVAQARVEGLELISADAQLVAYAVPVTW